jgi:hypothetical protein
MIFETVFLDCLCRLSHNEHASFLIYEVIIILLEVGAAGAAVTVCSFATRRCHCTISLGSSTADCLIG